MSTAHGDPDVPSTPDDATGVAVSASGAEAGGSAEASPAASGPVGDGAQRPPTGTQRRRSRFRWLLGPAIVLILVILIRTFIAAPFSIPSGSMEDTLQVGDRVLVSRLSGPETIQRGDIVVFDASDAFGLEVPERSLLGRLSGAILSLVGQGEETDYIKRVIGLPGDRVRCCDTSGRLVINGQAAEELYLYPGDKPSEMTFDVTVPKDRFWVMGDHRSQSGDSRAYLGRPGGGMVPAEDIIGKVWVRYWPPGRVGSVDQGQLSSIPRNGQ